MKNAKNLCVVGLYLSLQTCRYDDCQNSSKMKEYKVKEEFIVYKVTTTLLSDHKILLMR